MAHAKATGTANRTVDVQGKRLGIKKFGGERVIPGNIIVRQRGTSFHPGRNVMIGRDHTIFAVIEGTVFFRKMTGYKRAQKWVDVIPAVEAVAVKPVTKTEAVESEVVVAEPAKKAAKPKATKKTAAKA